MAGRNSGSVLRQICLPVRDDSPNTSKLITTYFTELKSIYLPPSGVVGGGDVFEDFSEFFLKKHLFVFDHAIPKQTLINNVVLSVTTKK